MIYANFWSQIYNLSCTCAKKAVLLHAENKMTSQTKGYLFGAIGAAAYGLNPLFALPLYADGMNPSSVLFLRYLMCVPCLALLMGLKKISFRLKWSELPTLIIIGILMAVSSLTLFLSYKYMDAGVASTILFIYPIMTAIIMGFCFHEHLGWKIATCLVVAFVGVLLLYYRGNGTCLSLTGVLLVVVSALTYAIYLVGVNTSNVGKMNSIKITFYVILISSICYGLCLRFYEALTLPTGWSGWGNCVGLSLCTTGISFVFTTIAVHAIGSTKTSILGALEPITAVIIGVSVFHEPMTWRTAIGILLIVGAVTVVIMQGGKHVAKRLSHRK